MITREQIRELSPGDVVKLTDDDGLEVRGLVKSYESRANATTAMWEGLTVGCLALRRTDGDVAGMFASPAWRLTVISRAPRPVYVNHPRTEPVEHDVVRDGKGTIRHCGPVSASTDPTWWAWEVEPGFRWTWTSTPPQPLTLLVDGETGQVVP